MVDCINAASKVAVLHFAARVRLESLFWGDMAWNPVKLLP